MPPTTTSSPEPGPYSGWTREKLIERLLALEAGASTSSEASNVTKPTPSSSLIKPLRFTDKPFDFSRHPRRKIALKFCYSGWEYGGLAFQSGNTPLPTVENTLFDALAKAHFVDPAGGFEGCGWERCGRTDRGVSGASQVVSLWVRSALPFHEIEGGREEPAAKSPTEPLAPPPETAPEAIDESLEDGFGSLDMTSSPNLETPPSPVIPPHSRPEFNFVASINRVLPQTIRILAWSPVSPTFSARFSCKWRHYKYFFAPDGLSIPAMRDAANRLIGEHDFRNLCKVDAAKQITSFKRDIKHVSIDALEGEDGEGLYVFNLIGSAFLYHQVRHIMAVLFLIGSGAEKPVLVTQLMNAQAGSEPLVDGDGPDPYPILDRRPEYNMADALPLMLWDCGYDPTELSWRTTGHHQDSASPNNANTRASLDDIQNGNDLYNSMQATHSRSRIFAALDRHFLLAAAKHHPAPQSPFPLPNGPEDLVSAKPPYNIPLGGGTFKRMLKYVPVLERKRLDTVDVINERWRLGKGMRKDLKKAEGDDGDE